MNDFSGVVADLEIPVVVDGHRLVLVGTDLGSIDQQRLRRRAGSLAEHEDDIRRALDRLFTGF